VEPQIFNEQEKFYTRAQIEPLLPVIFKRLYTSLSATLKEHVPEEMKEEEEKVEKSKIQIIIKVLQTIQTTLVT